MRRFTQCTIGTVFGLALSGAAWAQQQDLEVTMDVVPANASARAGREIKLPITLPETPRAGEASAFGLETANRARDLGREFGKAVSEAAREGDHGKAPPRP